MIKPIVKQRFFLKLPSEEATAQDLSIAHDLVDTLNAHRANCVGMAANMIGHRKRIIAVVDSDNTILVMLNPRIVSQTGSYQTSEGCLSLDGVRNTTRFRRITVEWQDANMEQRRSAFKGNVAQAIQHEVDHCNGVLV